MWSYSGCFIDGLQALLEKSPFGRISCPLEGFLERVPRFARSAEAEFELANRGVKEWVAVEALAIFDARDFLQPTRRAVALRQRNGAIEGNYRRGLNAHERVVQGHDAWPIGVTGRARLRVQGGDRRFDVIDRELAACGRQLHLTPALGDAIGVPSRSILVGKEQQIALGVQPAGKPRRVKVEQRRQCVRRGSRRQSVLYQEMDES